MPSQNSENSIVTNYVCWPVYGFSCEYLYVIIWPCLDVVVAVAAVVSGDGDLLGHLGNLIFAT